jgi:LacI family transcriptional regulator
MATLREVARRAGVSPMTVSRVVNRSQQVSPELRARVEQALAESGYIPNTVARNLRTRRTDTIALVMPDMTNSFFTALAHGVETAAREVNISLLIASSDEREDEERRLVQVLLQRQVDGILITPAGAGTQAIHQCQARGVPVVVVERRPGTPGVDVVRADPEAGALQLGRLLAGLGHRRMAVLTGPATVPTAVDRVAGFSRALVEESGLPAPAVVHGFFTIESGHAMTLAVMDGTPRPTALFAANNVIAIGVLNALAELGLMVPDDVAVVGFDDLPQAMVALPLLTVAAHPAFELGRRSVGILLDRLADPGRPAQEVVLTTEVTLRRSSGGPIEKSVEG